MNFLRHCYWVIRYGDWDCGWEMYKNKPMLSVNHSYYNGYHAIFHCYKLWIAVSY